MLNFANLKLLFYIEFSAFGKKRKKKKSWGREGVWSSDVGFPPVEGAVVPCSPQTMKCTSQRAGVSSSDLPGSSQFTARASCKLFFFTHL